MQTMENTGNGVVIIKTVVDLLACKVMLIVPVHYCYILQKQENCKTVYCACKDRRGGIFGRPIFVSV